MENVPFYHTHDSTLVQEMSADFWAGYVSGAAGIIIGNPLDLIKTRLQAGKIGANHLEGTTTANTVVATPQTFRGQFEHAGTLVRAQAQQPPSSPTALSMPSCS